MLTAEAQLLGGNGLYRGSWWCIQICITTLLESLSLFLPPMDATFDAVDGKQARLTSSSSQLGEPYDHGCDALARLCGEEVPSCSG